jgi:hypothetical protein
LPPPSCPFILEIASATELLALARIAHLSWPSVGVIGAGVASLVLVARRLAEHGPVAQVVRAHA